MLDSLEQNQEFNYQRLSLDEQKRRGILGRLTGIIADFKNPTRNGRKYNEQLWETVFNNPLVEEKLESRTIFGELGHPTDRTEIDMEKVAICLAERPKKNKSGQLVGIFDILDTPNGKILKTLCDYGTKIGISSRGAGDVETDRFGNESVNPDTYEFECFDAVLLPAVKAARLNYVTESLNKVKYNKSLKQKLEEELNKATAEQRKAMEESLDTFGVKLDEADGESSNVLDMKIIAYVEPSTNEGVPSGVKGEQYDEQTLAEWEAFTNKVEEFINTIGEVISAVESKHSISQYIDYYVTDNNGERKDGMIDLRLSDHPQTTTAKKIRNKHANILDSNYELVTITVNNKRFDTYDKAFEYVKNILDGVKYNKLNEAVNSDIYTIEVNGEALTDDEGNICEFSNQEDAFDYIDVCDIPNADVVKKINKNELNESLSVEDTHAILDAISYAMRNVDDEDTYDLKSLGSMLDRVIHLCKTIADDYHIKLECNSENCSDTEVEDSEGAVVNNEANLLEELQGALKHNNKLEKTIVELKEQLSVCYAKAADDKNVSAKLDSTANLLAESKHKNYALSVKIKTLEEELDKAKSDSKLFESEIKKLRSNDDSKYKSLKEDYNLQSTKYSKAIEASKQLNENLTLLKKEKESLNEAYQNLSKDFSQTKTLYANKLNKANELVEKYKTIAVNSVDKYIESQAIRLGVNVNEIKNRLSSKYTFKDIDLICEDLQNTRLNIGNLPFNTMGFNDGMSVRISTKKNATQSNVNEADEVDDALLNIAGLLKR